MRASVVALAIVPLVVAAGGAQLAACGAGSSSGDGAGTPPDGGDAARRDAPASTDDDGGLAAPTGPALLSQTGLYADFASRTVADGVMPYAPRFPFWVDGATKQRWLWLPPGTRIDTSHMDDWTFPVGTKVWKEIDVDGKPVETRLLMKVTEGGAVGWWMAAYVWKEDGSDAVATLDGAVDALGTPHDVPKQVDCLNCHENVVDVLLGVSAIQLSAPFSSAGDASTPSALAQLADAGRLTNPPSAEFDVPGDGVVKDALAYLHANCGNCHNDHAVRLATQTPMRLRLLVGQTTPEVTGAYTTTKGTVMKHPIDAATEVLVPGSPEQSGIWVRMGHRDYYAMPPVGTKVVDDAARETIRQFIVGFPP